MESFGHYRFSVIRYVPDIVREEFVNIGALVLDVSGARPAMVRFTRSWTRVLSLDPNVDLETLQALEEDINLQFAQMPNSDSFMHSMHESFSNNLQFADFKSRAAESMDSLAEDVMVRYVYPPARNTLFAMVGAS